MGMSASQARFLSLTARKTNTEYEGQQINQQRTTLSNESAGYYSQLTSLNVPTPPSTQDYSKISYSFIDGTETNTINQMIATKEDGRTLYLVNYTQSTLADNVVTNGSVIVSQAKISLEGGNIDGYAIGSTPLRVLNDTAYVNSNYNQTHDYYLKEISDYDNVLALEKEYKTKLDEKYYNGVPHDWYVRYVKDSNKGTWTPVFYDKFQVDNADYSKDTGVSLSSVKSYVWGQSTENHEVKNAKARVEQDSSGRYVSISIYDTNEDGSIIEDRYTTYHLNSTTITDDDAYNDAMNKYNYDKSRYDKTIQDINAKIQIIQVQDKNLELKLKQLDTEQNAISTEMDAVKKVISKNVESSFKTFSA